MSDYQERIAKALQIEVVQRFCWELDDDKIEELARRLSVRIERALRAAAIHCCGHELPSAIEHALIQGIEELEKPT